MKSVTKTIQIPETLEKLRKFVAKRKIAVITARPQLRPGDISFRPGEPYFGPPTGNETLCIDYIDLL